MEEIILKDILRIEGVGSNIDNAKILQKELVAKYRNEIPNIVKDLDRGYPALNGDTGRCPNYMQNLTNIKAKLELLLVKIRDEKNKPQIQPVSPISFVNNNNNHSDNHSNNHISNTNNNSNTVDVKVLFEDARNKIEDDTSLGEEELQEILGKINELEELHNSDERPRSKWNKSKEVMTWVLSKGSKIASVVLPLITEVIKQ